MLKFLALGLLLPLSASAFFFEKKAVPVKSEGGHWVSEWVEVDIPAGLLSLQVVVLGSNDTRVQVTDLIDPTGEVYLNSGGKPLTAYAIPLLRNVQGPNRSDGVVPGTGTLIVPNNPKLSAPRAGKWKMRSLSLQKPVVKEITFLVMGKSEAKKGSVNLKVWVAPDTYWTKKEDRVEALLEGAAEFLETAGIELEVKSVDLLAKVPKSPFDPSKDLAAIAYEMNDPNAINAYFMGEMDLQNKPVNGLACLGGPVSIPHKHGCFVSLFASANGDEYSVDQQSKIVAHEILHYLGLFHTVDTGYMMIGTVYDSLDDTHTEVDGSNLMDPGIPNQHPTLSPMQKKMILLSPAVIP